MALNLELQTKAKRSRLIYYLTHSCDIYGEKKYNETWAEFELASLISCSQPLSITPSHVQWRINNAERNLLSNIKVNRSKMILSYKFNFDRTTNTFSSKILSLIYMPSYTVEIDLSHYNHAKLPLVPPLEIFTTTVHRDTSTESNQLYFIRVSIQRRTF